jgi:hypothetical protein
VGVEGVALEDHRQVPVLRVDAVDPAVPDADGPLGGLLEAGDHAQGRGLATARRAEQDEELPVLHLEVEVVDGDDIGEPFGDVVEADAGHRPAGYASRRQYRITNGRTGDGGEAAPARPRLPVIIAAG